MKNVVGTLAGAAIGAGVMYLLDPTRGKRRRAFLRETTIHVGKVVGRNVNITTRDAANRIKGVIEEAKRFVSDERVDDAKLLDRVRTAVGRVSSHPNVEVIVDDGEVTLLGPVVDLEQRSVLRAAKAVWGVERIINRMRPYRRLSTEQTEGGQSGHWFDFMRAHWSPSTRILMGVLGASAAAAGLGIGGKSGSALVAAGTAVGARAVSNFELSRLVGYSADIRHRAA